MSSKTRVPRTRLHQVTNPLRELSADELAAVTGGACPCTCPRPRPNDYTETYPKSDTDLMDLD